MNKEQIAAVAQQTEMNVDSKNQAAIPAAPQTATQNVPATTNGAELQPEQRKIKNFVNMKSGDINKLFTAYLPQMKKIIPSILSPEKVLGIVTTSILKNPELAECSQPSLIGAMLQAAALGLDPTSNLNQCYLIPYKNKELGTVDCQFQIGYMGYMALAQRSGVVEDIYADVVRQGDLFKVKKGLHLDLIHEPLEGGDDDRPITHAYAVAYLYGKPVFKVLSISEIEKLRLKNASQKYGLKGAWKTDYATMCETKALKALCKRLPLATEVLAGINADEGKIGAGAFKNGNVAEDVDYDVVDETTGEIVKRQ